MPEERSDARPDQYRDALSADPIRFLIVDDTPGNMVALEALLRREGLVIDMVASAREALELLLVNDCALAFLDVQMPETDSYEPAELMRGAEWRPWTIPLPHAPAWEHPAVGLRPASAAGPIAANRPARAEGAVPPRVAGSGASAVGGSSPPPPPAADRSGAAPSRIGGSRVLVIEDEPLVALDICEGLRAAEAGQVAVARTVGQALKAVSAGPIDIALLDGNPGGDAVDEVASALERRGIPFCFASGYGREHLPKPFAHVPVIGKPFRTEALLPVLGRLIGRAAGACEPAAGARAL